MAIPPRAVTAVIAASLLLTLGAGIGAASTKTHGYSACATSHGALTLSHHGKCAKGTHAVTLGARGKTGSRGPAGPGTTVLATYDSTTQGASKTLTPLPGLNELVSCNQDFMEDIATQVQFSVPTGTVTVDGSFTTNHGADSAYSIFSSAQTVSVAQYPADDNYEGEGTVTLAWGTHVATAEIHVEAIQPSTGPACRVSTIFTEPTS